MLMEQTAHEEIHLEELKRIHKAALVEACNGREVNMKSRGVAKDRRSGTDSCCQFSLHLIPDVMLDFRWN